MKRKNEEIITKLLSEIRRHDKPENRINYQRFFKEKLKEPIGLKTPVLRKVSSQQFKDIRQWQAKDILDLCDDLLASGKRYMRFFVFEWALKVKGQYAKSDFGRFERWLKKYVEGWGTCDHLCCGPLGYILLRFPDLVSKTGPWVGSPNRWLRRAAAVSLIVPVRNGILLDEVFRAANNLLTDNEDLVQKGYGWMLKEAANTYRKEVFTYVLKNKDRMPRTALRYAIEKMPAAMRKKAMA
ncbi:MAG: DNA alkylation repair protein [Candidatus Zixiibacteriota bacterium]|nr:MAG: DNA alkylation repair protein [candidate division Zixibacteria bacterium]